MEFTVYQERAMDTCMPSCENIGYMMHNLIGEVGEACEKIIGLLGVRNENNSIVQHLKIFIEISKFYGMTAKKIRHGNDVLLSENARWTQEQLMNYIGAPKMQEVALELGDVLWQLNGVCSILGISLDEVAAYNLGKLQDRASRGVIDGDGDNR